VFTIILPNFESLFKVSLLFSSCLFGKGEVKNLSKVELLSWNDPTVHVCCSMLARASTKTFVSRVQKTAKKSLLTEKFVSRVTH